MKTEITHNSSHYIVHPVHKNGLPPCNNACPASEKIQSWIRLVQNGKLQQAWEVIIQDNPLPAIHGRICYHNCETHCNRKNFDDSVKIHCIERFLGDLAITENWKIKKQVKELNENEFKNTINSKKVLIIGAGPAGLSCAYHLTQLGYNVTIYDKQDRLGGMIASSIPQFRLPDDILQQETERLINMMQINVKLNYNVTDVINEKQTGNFDAICLTIGSHQAKTLSISTDNSSQQCSALHFLTLVKQQARSEQINISNNIDFTTINNLVVYGGSNTAIDVARSAKRLGIKNISIVYHRSMERMNAHKFEINSAIQEGIIIKVLHQIHCIQNQKLVLNIVTLDENGNPQPTGRQEKISIDLLVFAMGQKTDSNFLKKITNLQFNNNGQIIVDEQMMTGEHGIFAGGDSIPSSQQSITMATGHGKKLAQNIDNFLQIKFPQDFIDTSSTHTKQTIFKHQSLKSSNIKQPILYKNLHLWFKDQHLTIDTEQNNSLNIKTETILGIDKKNAIYESQRCFSCATCFSCDGCYAICPQQAIIKLGYGKGYKIDYNLCNNCGLCYENCPCSAIIKVNNNNDFNIENFYA